MAMQDAPTIVSGERDPLSTLSSRIKPDVRDEILLWEPEAAPLTLLTGAFKNRREVGNSEFDWIEKDAYPREVTVVGAVTNVATTLTLSAGQGSYIGRFFVLLNRRTREIIHVTSVSTDTPTIVRGIGGVGIAMNDGDVLEYIGTAYEDGGGKGDLKSIKEVREWNVCQIFRTPYGFTGRQSNTNMFGGRDPMTERKVQGIEHKKSMELSFFFGKRSKRSGPNSKGQNVSGGAEFFIRSNVWDLNGIEPTERAFVEWLEFAMKYGTGGQIGTGSGKPMKWFFASRRWITHIEFWARNRIQYKPIDERVGMKVGFLDTTHGTVVLVPMNIFNGEHASYGFLLDMNHVRYVYHQGRDTHINKDIEDKGVDGDEEEYLTDCSLEFSVEAAHGIAKGLPL